MVYWPPDRPSRTSVCLDIRPKKAHCKTQQPLCCSLLSMQPCMDVCFHQRSVISSKPQDKQLMLMQCILSRCQALDIYLQLLRFASDLVCRAHAACLPGVRPDGMLITSASARIDLNQLAQWCHAFMNWQPAYCMDSCVQEHNAGVLLVSRTLLTQTHMQGTNN